MASPTIFRQLFEELTHLTTEALFPIVGIPVMIFAFGVAVRFMVKSAVFNDGTISAQEKGRVFWDAWQFGLELCLLSIGVYWRAAYSTNLLHNPGGVFLVMFAVFLLLICTLARLYLRRSPIIDTFIADSIGLTSVALSLLAIQVAMT